MSYRVLKFAIMPQGVIAIYDYKAYIQRHVDATEMVIWYRPGIGGQIIARANSVEISRLEDRVQQTGGRPGTEVKVRDWALHVSVLVERPQQSVPESLALVLVDYDVAITVPFEWSAIGQNLTLSDNLPG